jgi:tetratricopeptide (TPR) repeat protein
MMGQKRNLFIAWLLACGLWLCSVPADADWHQDYQNGKKALAGSEYAKAETLFRRALRDRKDPGKDLLPSVGLLGGVIPNYCPRLMLAAALSHEQGKAEEARKLFEEAESVERSFFGDQEREEYEKLKALFRAERAAAPPAVPPPPAKPSVRLEKEGSATTVYWQAAEDTEYEVMLGRSPNADDPKVKHFYPVRPPFRIEKPEPGTNYVCVRAKNAGGEKLSDWSFFEVAEAARAAAATPVPPPVVRPTPAPTPAPTQTPVVRERATAAPVERATEPPRLPTRVPAAAPKPEDDLVRAESLYRRGDIAAARTILDLIVRSDPKNAAACFWLGRCYAQEFIRSGGSDAALKQGAVRNFRRALRINPDARWKDEIAEAPLRALFDEAAGSHGSP